LDKTPVIPWPDHPDQINPAMLDDIAERASAAIDPEHKVSKQAILDIINNEIADHYRKAYVR